MRFVVRVIGKPFPYPELGPPGSELAGYIPAGTQWKQLNYGQGEGQVEMAGCEWGLYQTYCGALAIELHLGKCSAPAAFELVRRVAEATCGGCQFDIFLQGTAEP